VRAELLSFLIASLVLIAAHAQTNPPENDPAWGCYDPAPGHPTAPERAAFIERASAAAVKAEQDYGVPAAALAAMAAQESGYGWTRIALFANNYFGWKGTEGLASAYHLACQPTENDPNAYYVRYSSLEESMLAVAARLHDSPYYKFDTARYRADLNAGVDPALAAKLWIDAIAPNFNGDPARYRRSLRRMMNDPTTPSDNINPTTALYRFAPKPQAPAKYADIASSKAYAEIIALAKHNMDPGVRYTDACIDGSGTIETNYPEYEGYPVKRCIYTLGDLKGLVYTLHPSTAQVATWVAFACIRAGAPDQLKCARRLFWPSEPNVEGIFNSNNGQFPVAGNVIERGDEAGCDEPTTYYNIQFRHGVTVQLADEKKLCLEGARTIDQQESDRKAKIGRFRNVGRVSALTLAEYQTTLGKTISTNSPEHLEWAQLNQLSHLTALDDGVNVMLNIQAERLFGTH
jgi:hypothetical protein